MIYGLVIDLKVDLIVVFLGCKRCIRGVVTGGVSRDHTFGRAPETLFGFGSGMRSAVLGSQGKCLCLRDMLIASHSWESSNGLPNLPVRLGLSKTRGQAQKRSPQLLLSPGQAPCY